jgi:O-acetyl-ADP-ribose deacetylase (regulator of RNase III)
MSYSQHEKTRAEAWKRWTRTLDAEAKEPAAYVDKDGNQPGPVREFCLPSQFAEHNLLPAIRQPALDVFRELGIPWHAGVDAGPSNHLLSSQVQCANALTAMMDEPGRIKTAFGQILAIDEVLEIEPGRYLTFEYIGPTDFFSECPGGERVRGAHCTSVDAAFLHRARDGVVELVLVEWKYTESYRLRKPDPERDKIRAVRYAAAVGDPSGPIRDGLLSFEHLLDEPFYQLVRQQLLAHALEQAGAEGADRVRVVHVLPAGNTAYQESLARPEHRALGETVSEVWQKLLRHQDRFLSIDSAIFLDHEITSSEYVYRYGGTIVRGLHEVLAYYEIDPEEEPDLAGALEDALEIDGHVVISDEGVSLVNGERGLGLDYPFTVAQLEALGDESDRSGDRRIELVRGDILDQDVDVIVTAANAGLRGGGGVDAAVHQAAGPELLKACRPLAPCPPGSAVITPAFALRANRYVVHAVGPHYQGPDDAAALRAAYQASLAKADEVFAQSIAFPSLSTGVYGYPQAEAAVVSVQALREADTEVRRIVLVAYGDAMYQHWDRALSDESPNSNPG